MKKIITTIIILMVGAVTAFVPVISQEVSTMLSQFRNQAYDRLADGLDVEQLARYDELVIYGEAEYCFSDSVSSVRYMVWLVAKDYIVYWFNTCIDTDQADEIRSKGEDWRLRLEPHGSLIVKRQRITTQNKEVRQDIVRKQSIRDMQSFSFISVTKIAEL
ncbi:hypothetical protein ACFL04_04020 [Patescibacteria group bacterium]